MKKTNLRNSEQMFNEVITTIEKLQIIQNSQYKTGLWIIEYKYEIEEIENYKTVIFWDNAQAAGNTLLGSTATDVLKVGMKYQNKHTNVTVVIGTKNITIRDYETAEFINKIVPTIEISFRKK